jgi:MFS family permease
MPDMLSAERTEAPQPLAARLFDRAVGTSLAGAPRMRRRTLVVLAGVLVLDWADRNILGGLAPELQRDLHISNSQLGLLAASFSIVGGVASLPLGRLVDRARRLTLLASAVALWSLAMLAVGAAQSFLWLFGARLLLGAIAATAGPATPSLVGDLVPDAQRARVLGFIDSGQLLGTGVGYVLSAFVVAYLSWRWGFWLLAIPGALVVVLLRHTPEPDRTQRRRRRTESYREALQTVVTIRTNVIVVIAASVGNLFFAAVSTFAVVFATQQYGLTTAQADLGVIVVAVGAVAGILGGGRLGDWLVRRGVQTGRLWVAAVGLPVAAVLGTPVLFLHSLPLAALLITIGTGALNAATPTLDAVRLDVVPPHLRGRAESLRTVIRTLVEGFAPLVIGVLADHLAGGGHAGLRLALLLVMPTLALNGLLLLFAMRSYPREAAAVAGAPAPASGGDRG